MDIPLLTSDIDEKLMRNTVAKCYGTYSRGFHVSAEHYRYLVEQIVSLRQFIQRLGECSPTCTTTPQKDASTSFDTCP